MSLGAKLREEAARLIQLSVLADEHDRPDSTKHDVDHSNKNNLFNFEKMTNGFQDSDSLSRGGGLKKAK